MKNTFSRLICAAFLLLVLSGTVQADLLLWEVNNSDLEFITGTGKEIIPLATVRAAADYDGAVDFARVAATAEDGTVAYLSLQYYAGSGDPTFGPPTVDAGEIDEFNRAGPSWANLSGYMDGTYSFAIELGNFVGEGDAEEWNVFARSQSATYADLVTAGFVTPGELSMPGYLPWTGGRFTVVPEPTSGLLLLVGGALLALRRRRPRLHVEG